AGVRAPEAARRAVRRRARPPAPPLRRGLGAAHDRGRARALPRPVGRLLPARAPGEPRDDPQPRRPGRAPRRRLRAARRPRGPPRHRAGRAHDSASVARGLSERIFAVAVAAVAVHALDDATVHRTGGLTGSLPAAAVAVLLAVGLVALYLRTGRTVRTILACSRWPPASCSSCWRSRS